MKKKIIFFLDTLYVNGKKNAGMPSVSNLLKKATQNDQFEVHLITREDKKNLSDLSKANIQIFSLQKNIFKNKYLAFAYGIFLFILANLEYFKYVCALLKKCPNDNFIIYSTVDYVLTSNLLRIFYKKRVKIVMRMYGILGLDIITSLAGRMKNYKSYYSFVSKFDYYVITNDGTGGDKAGDYFNIPRNRVKFWVNGTDKCLKKINIKEQFSDDLVLFCASRFNNYKRVERIILACKELDIPIKLVIAGDGELNDYYRSLAGENTVFLGMLTNEETLDFIFTCDLFISMYDLSNIGNPILQALSFGKPIITYNSGNTANFLKPFGENVVLIPHCDDEEIIVKNLRESIIDLYHNPLKRQIMAKNTKAIVADLINSWDERLDMEIDFLKDVYLGFDSEK